MSWPPSSGAHINDDSFNRDRYIGRPELPALGRACLGELVVAYILAFFGCGSVMSAVITGTQVGLWQVAVVWGFGVALAI